MNVLITGATGFVGKTLVKILLEENIKVTVLTRNVAQAALQLGHQCDYVFWDAKSSLPEGLVDSADSVINLMGEGIADKFWTIEQKKKLYNSRIDGTRFLVEAIKNAKVKPKNFVSTSAIGIYGDRGTEELTEESKLGDDFLANLCKAWEAEAMKAQEIGVNVSLLRVGIVLGKNGGALKKMIPPFKMGVGGALGNGKQVMSWIFIEDLAKMYLWLVKNPHLKGAFNATAPNPMNNKLFSNHLASALKRPALFPVPAFVIKTVFGEMSTVLLSSQKVMPAKFQQQGFKFESPSLEMALKRSVS